MASQASLVSREDPYQPIILTRSDALPTFQVASVALCPGNPPRQDKRKWDQVEMEDDSQQNVAKAPMRDQSYHEPALIDDEEDCQDSDDPTTLNGKKPGRKPMTDDGQSDDGDDPKVKRKAQNRIAQRAFRERKERYVKELESKLKQIQETHIMAANHLFRENHYLRSILYRLETENVALKGIHIQHGPLSGKPMHQWITALQEHQQQFTNDPLASIMSPEISSSTLLPSAPPMNVVPALSVASNPVESPAPEQPPEQSQEPQERRVQYTFAISTPATLRSRHEQQQRSLPIAPKQQQQQQHRHSTSPIELVRLYPGEHITPTLSSPPASSPTLSTTSDRPPSPASTASNPWFNDHEFDQLLSEPLFDTRTGGLTHLVGMSNGKDGAPSHQLHPQCQANDGPWVLS